MSGFGGFSKLSSQQQASLLDDLAPAFATGTSMYDKAAIASDGVDDGDLNGLIARLSACLADIGSLMRAIEEGATQGSTLDPGEAMDTAKILVSEVAALNSQIRMALVRIRDRSRSK